MSVGRAFPADRLFNRRAKWWQVELRFARHLTDREVRTLRAPKTDSALGIKAVVLDPQPKENP